MQSLRHRLLWLSSKLQKPSVPYRSLSNVVSDRWTKYERSGSFEQLSARGGKRNGPAPSNPSAPDRTAGSRSSNQISCFPRLDIGRRRHTRHRREIPTRCRMGGSDLRLNRRNEADSHHRHRCLRFRRRYCSVVGRVRADGYRDDSGERAFERPARPVPAADGSQAVPRYRRRRCSRRHPTEKHHEQTRRWPAENVRAAPFRRRPCL